MKNILKYNTLMRNTHRYLTSKFMNQIKTFVFLDLETTGLPHLEHNKTRIIELCAISVQADHIELGCFPRVHNKLSFCFNPKKTIQPEASQITGLFNDMLEKQPTFSSDIVELMKKWFEMSLKPICLVAHNGDRFDYPILRTEIEKTGTSLSEDILCIDSLVAFRALDIQPLKPRQELVPFEFNNDYDEVLCKFLDEYEQSVDKDSSSTTQAQKINETTPKKQIINSSQHQQNKRMLHTSSNRTTNKSYKLTEVYKRLTAKDPVNAHEAEGDVQMLICCAAFYGEKFVAFANENSKKFCDVRLMVPGKRLGL